MEQEIEVGSKWTLYGTRLTGTPSKEFVIVAVGDTWVAVRGETYDPTGLPAMWYKSQLQQYYVPKPKDDILYVWLDLVGVSAGDVPRHARVYATKEEARVLIKGNLDTLIVTYNRTTGEMSVEPA